MARQFPYGKLHKYPHLASKEAMIWDRFVAQNAEWAELCEYDVTCGEIDSLPPDTPDYLKKDWHYLRSWKIDVVAIKGGIHFIIEVRPSAGLNAIGEVQNKAEMYQEMHPELPEPEPIIITDLERPDIRRICGRKDIGYIVV